MCRARGQLGQLGDIGQGMTRCDVQLELICCARSRSTAVFGALSTLFARALSCLYAADSFERSLVAAALRCATGVKRIPYGPTSAVQAPFQQTSAQ